MNKIKVLLIDNEENARAALIDYLMLHTDFEVVDYGTGQAGWADLKRNGGKYTTVVLDWTLTPALPGNRVLERIRESYPNLPVIVITGRAPTGGPDALERGAYKYLQRPINHAELINAISNLAEQDLVFSEMVEDVHQYLSSDACLAWKLDRQVRQLNIVAWGGKVETTRLQSLHLALDTLSQQPYFQNRRPIFFEDVETAQEIEPHYREEAKKQQWHSLIRIPLFYQNQPIGLIDSFAKEPFPFNNLDQQNAILFALKAYANQAAATARNADLTIRLQKLNEINKLLSGTYQEKIIIRRILTTGLELVGGNIGWIYSKNKKEDKLFLEDWLGIPDETGENERALGKEATEGITGYVARTGEVRNIHDTSTYKRHIPTPNLSIRSELAVPLRRGEQTVGVLTVKSLVKNAFTRDDEDLLMALAAQAAVAIERAKLIKHMEMVSRLALTNDADMLPKYVVEAVYDLTGVEAAFWMMSDRKNEGGKFLRIKASTSGIPEKYVETARLSATSDDTIHALAWKHQSPVIKNNIFDDQNPIFIHKAYARSYGWHSYMAVPVLGQDNEALGTLSLYGMAKNQFEQLEVETMQSFANQVAIAIQQQKRTAALQQLTQISQTVTERITDHPQELLEKVAELARALTGADCIVIYPYDPGKKQFYDIDNIATVGLRDKLSITNKPRRTGFASFIRGTGAVVVHDADAGSVEIGLKSSVKTNPKDIETVQEILANARFIRREDIKSFIGIPLRAREKENNEEGETVEVGILYINFRTLHHFSSEELQIIDIYAHHVANVVWSARLYTAERRQASELEAVRQTALNILAQEDDLDALLKALVKEATKLLKGKGGKVYIRVPGKEQVQLLAAENVDHNIQPLGYTINFGEGLAGRVIQTKKPMIVTDHSKWDGRLKDLTHLFGAVIEVPLMRGEEAIGVLSVFDDAEKRQFTEDDFPILERLAQQAALAIYNATLVEQERVLRQQAETLREVSIVITSNLNMVEVQERILDGLHKVVEFQNAGIQLIRGDKREQVAFHSNVGKRADPSIIRPLSEDPLVLPIVTSQKPLILPDTRNHLHFGHEESEAVASWVCLPLVYGSKTIGTMTLDHQQPGFYTYEISNLLGLFADQAAIALQNALLFEEVQQYQDAQIQAVNIIAQSIATSTNIRLMLQGILESIKSLIPGTELAEVYTLARNIHKLTRMYANGPMITQESRTTAVGIGVVGWVAEHNQSQIVPNVHKDERYKQTLESTSSEMAVPLRRDNELIGVLNLEHSQIGAFTEKDLRLAEAIAALIVVAMQIDNQFRELEERAKRLTHLQKTTTTILAKPTDKNNLLMLIVDNLSEIFKDAPCIIRLYNSKEEAFTEAVVSRRIPEDIASEFARHKTRPQGLGYHVIATKNSYYVSGSQKHNKHNLPGIREEFRQIGVESVAILPMISEDKIIGTLYLCLQEPYQFTPNDKQILELFASQAAVAINNFRLLDQLASQIEELKELDKEKDRFLSTVSHELRTPLTSIKGSLENTLNNLYGTITDEQRTKLEIALASVDDEARIIENVLNLVHIQEGRVMFDSELASMADILNQITQRFEYYTEERNITLELALPKETRLITLLDETKIKQVLSNLVHNAVKFTPKGGWVRLAACEQNGMIQIQVSDTGIGIPKDKREKIFDRFYQVDSSFTRRVGGAGIGLNVVKEYVELHGGKIWVESELGQGSTFTFTLPKR